MRWIWLVAVVGCVMLLGLSQPVAAFDSQTIINKTSPAQQHSRTTMPVHGLTTAPPGYVGFCRRHPHECRSGPGVKRLSARTDRLHLTSERWIMLIAVNSYINDLIRPKTDRELYGVEENWTFPKAAGDCEDYVLLKRRELLRRGWPESALLITVVLDEQGDGHAVLTVRTAQGDFVLDNKHSRVLLWRDVPYTFIKRQSYRTPQLWVSLTPQLGRRAVAASSADER